MSQQGRSHPIEMGQEVDEGEVAVPLGKLGSTVRTAVRHLDNLVDITVTTVPEADNSNLSNRAVGLGVMGLTDMLEQMGMAYDSPAACEMADELVEFISWHAIDTSADLARERGPYPNFVGSGWSEGLVPIDTLTRLERDRGSRRRRPHHTDGLGPPAPKGPRGRPQRHRHGEGPTASIGRAFARIVDTVVVDYAATVSVAARRASERSARPGRTPCPPQWSKTAQTGTHTPYGGSLSQSPAPCTPDASR